MDSNSVIHVVLPRHEKHLLGLPYPVTLLDGAEQVSNADSDRFLGIAVPDAEELATVVALILCFLPVRLIGAEARLIRRAMGMRGKDLAAALDLTSETLSRAEHGKKDISPWFDKMLRMAAVLCLQDGARRVGGEPKGVVSLRPAPREPGSWPVIEAHYVQINRDTMGWDVRLEEIRSAPVENTRN